MEFFFSYESLSFLNNFIFHKVSKGEVHDLIALNYNGRQILHDCYEVTGCTAPLPERGIRLSPFLGPFGFPGPTLKDLLKLSFLSSTSHFYFSDTFFHCFLLTTHIKVKYFPSPRWCLCSCLHHFTHSSYLPS